MTKQELKNKLLDKIEITDLLIDTFNQCGDQGFYITLTLVKDKNSFKILINPKIR